MNRFFAFTNIRKKLLVGFLALVLLTFGIASALAWSFYSRALIQNTINDRVNSLSQHAHQLANVNRELRSLACSVALNDSMQRFLTNRKIIDSGKEIPYLDIVKTERSAFSDARRQTLSTSYVLDYSILVDDVLYRSKGEGIYYTIPSSEAQALLYGDAQSMSTISMPHITSIANSKAMVQTYFYQIPNVQESSIPLGVLMLDLSCDYFNGIVATVMDSFEGYAWRNGDYIILSEGVDVLSEDPASMKLFRSHNGTDVYTSQNGYYFYSPVSDSEWSIITFISQDSILDQTRGSGVLFCTVLVLILLMCIALINPLVRYLLSPLEQLTDAMQRVGAGELDTAVHFDTGDEIAFLAESFSNMTANLKELMESRIESEKQKQRLRFELLAAQINPHFIYNTLNSIVYMAQKENNTDIVKMTTAFICMLQGTLSVKEKSLLIPVAKDQALIKEYIVIQSYRYEGLFDFVSSVDDEARDCAIPRTMIQPLVENAIFHGIYPKGKGTVTLTVKRETDTVLITVSDDGVGMSEDKVKAILSGELTPSVRVDTVHSISYQNIRQRLTVLYGEAYDLTIASRDGEGTSVNIRLPYRRCNGE